MARAVVLKYTPTLRFVFDDSVIRGNKLLRIIEELEKDSPPAPEPQDPAAL
jgi:ribosome-binding factor A